MFFTFSPFPFPPFFSTCRHARRVCLFALHYILNVLFSFPLFLGNVNMRVHYLGRRRSRTPRASVYALLPLFSLSLSLSLTHSLSLFLSPSLSPSPSPFLLSPLSLSVQTYYLAPPPARAHTHTRTCARVLSHDREVTSQISIKYKK